MLVARWGRPSRGAPSHWATSLGTGTTWERWRSCRRYRRNVAEHLERSCVSCGNDCGLAIRRLRYRIFFFSLCFVSTSSCSGFTRRKMLEANYRIALIPLCGVFRALLVPGYPQDVPDPESAAEAHLGSMLELCPN